jgi:hypothetical protein
MDNESNIFQKVSGSSRNRFGDKIRKEKNMPNPTMMFMGTLGWDCMHRPSQERSQRMVIAIEQMLDSLRTGRSIDGRRFLLKRIPDDWGLNLTQGNILLDVVKITCNDSRLTITVDRSLLDAGFTQGELWDFTRSLARHPDVWLPTELVIRGAREGESAIPYQVYSLGPPPGRNRQNTWWQRLKSLRWHREKGAKS